MTKTFMLITFFTAISNLLQAQLIWNFTTAAVTGTVTNIAAVSNVTQGNNYGTTTFLAAELPASSSYTGFSAGFNGSCCASTGMLSTVASSDNAGSAYIQVVLTPAAGYAVNISSIRWGNFSIPTTGPTTLSIYASNDNFATATPVVTLPTVAPNATAWVSLFSTTAITGLTGTALTIRIYASGGTGAVTAGVANWRVDDLIITATAQTGTAGQIPKYTDATTFANSIITENNNKIGIGTTTPAEKLDINGNLKFTGVLLAGATPTGGVDGQFLKSTGPTTAPVWFTASTGSAGWGLTGNAGTIPGTNFIGTTDAQRLVFKTAGVENATILTGGNMGIGTQAPTAKLDIAGNIKITDGTQGASKVLTSDANGLATWANTPSVTSTAWGLLGNGGTDPYAVTNPNFIGTTDDKDLVFKRNGVRSGKISSLNTSFGKGALEVGNDVYGYYNTAIGINALAIADESNENTAIGSYALANYLVGEYNTAIGSNSLLNYISGDYNTAIGNGSLSSLTYGRANIGIGIGAGSGVTTGSNNVFIGTTAFGSLPANLSNNIILADGEGNRRININELGNVGIGTITPAEKLDVNGNIYTTGKILIGQTNTAAVAPYALAVNGWAIFTKATVKLNANWPDYVFEPTYNLPTLAEVEAYLTRYKHLPDMPSAATVKEKGIDLGDNQTILVKKVEELTLYIIALNKKVEALVKENEELKKKPNQDK